MTTVTAYIETEVEVSLDSFESESMAEELVNRKYAHPSLVKSDKLTSDVERIRISIYRGDDEQFLKLAKEYFDYHYGIIGRN